MLSFVQQEVVCERNHCVKRASLGSFPPVSEFLLIYLAGGGGGECLIFTHPPPKKGEREKPIMIFHLQPIFFICPKLVQQFSGLYPSNPFCAVFCNVIIGTASPVESVALCSPALCR